MLLETNVGAIATSAKNPAPTYVMRTITFFQVVLCCVLLGR